MFQNKSTRLLLLLAAIVLLFSYCASTTIIQSDPIGAKVFLNGEPVGRTPYTHQDTRISGSVSKVKLEKEGYEPLETSFARDEEVDAGAIVGGLLIIVPFLWTMKYKPTHFYELKPLTDSAQNLYLQKKHLKSKAEKLRELKQLLDEKIITQQEFEREKKKILDEEEK
ncbi:MAG: hypothetical protein RLZZ161_473 [Bacteroidota bacterium]|jgi:hypothetical protein